MELIYRSAALVILSLTVSCSTKNVMKRTEEVPMYFTAKPDTINAGETSTLYWYISNNKRKDVVNIVGLDKDISSNGSIIVNPKNSTEYSLELQRAGRVYTKSVNIYVRNKRIPSIARFESNSYYVTSGDSITLTWEVKDAISEKIIIEGVGEFKANNSSIRVPVKDDKIFTLKLIDNNSTIDSESIEVIVKVKPKLIGFSTGPDDGRFTIGGNGKRLMYGWPIPQSTSHFILKVNERFATNSAKLANESIFYVTGKQILKGVNGSVYTEISYYLDGVELTQRLIPVDVNFNLIQLNKYGQYYRIEYEIINKSNKPKNVGINCLIDMMLDDNDAAKVEYGNLVVDNEIEILKTDLPNEIYIYQDIANKSAHAGKFVFNTPLLNPDRVYIGSWPYLSKVTWDVELNNQIFGDVAMLLKWDEMQLLSEAKRIGSFYYGLRNKGAVSAITSSNRIKETKFSIYFKSGSHRISEQEKVKIKNALSKATNIAGIVISGYADATGSSNYNFELSLKRVKDVSSFCAKNGVDRGKIIPKAYGETHSQLTIKNDKEFRKCDILIYTLDNNE
jgi:outer membrane protein OmpA-like peptidoglycan-associated protein